MRRAQVSATVPLVPTRHGKLQQIDLIAALDVFEDRPGLDHIGFHRLHRPQLGSKRIDQRNRFQIQRQVERQRGPLERFEHVGEHAAVRIETRNIVKKECRRRGNSFKNNFGERADLQIPMGAGDLFELFKPLDIFQPIAQVASLDRWRLYLRCSCHGSSLSIVLVIYSTSSKVV